MVDNMKKTLPINNDPYIRTYTHHGFLQSIISSRDKVCYDVTDAVAEVVVDRYENYDWEVDNDRMTYSIEEGNSLSFFTNKWNYGMNIAFCRKCQKTDEISFTINKQLYSNAWSAISIFLIKDNVEHYNSLDHYNIVVGNFEKDGIFYSVQKGIHERIKSGLNKPLNIKLLRDNSSIYIQYSDDTYSSETILICELDNDDEWKIGFGINLGNSMYYEWLFSNYVQLFVDKNGWMPIDYLVNQHKDWSIYTTNPFIDYHCRTLEDLDIIGCTELQYIKMQIKLGCYVEVLINDRLNDKKSSGEGSFFHQNMIYGFDDEEEVLYLVYYKMGKLEHNKLSYSDYESERNQLSSRKIYIHKYNPSYERFHLSTKMLAQVYFDYLQGDNIALYEPYLEEEGVFGLSCYERICRFEEMNNVIADIRITHLLLEHTECNIDRVKYLFFCSQITDEKYNILNNYLQIQKQNLFIARNKCLKALLGASCIIQI